MAKLTDQQKIDLVAGYLSGLSSLKLSAKYSISISAVFSILKKRNIKSRTDSEKSRKYTLNESYFEKVDTEDKAYFLGFLYADGYNHETRGAVLLTLQDRDRHIIEEFKKCLKCNKPLYFIERSKKNPKWKDVYKLEVNSKKLSNDLSKLGCKQNKALTLEFPTNEQVPSYLLKHFIRGYLDGDGNIGERQVSIVSSKMFIRELSKELDKIGVETRIFFAKKGNNITQRMCLRTQSDSLRFLDFIYIDSNFYLKRKHNKFLVFKKIHSHSY